MAERPRESGEGMGALTESPGGFIFGIQGWTWGEQRVCGITFFLDNTAKVTDQWGRPIRGTVTPDGKQVHFAKDAPTARDEDREPARDQCATHAQVIAALAAERVDWQKVNWAGWPQLPYDQLKDLPRLPNTPEEELLKIRDSRLRKAALRARRERDDVVARESAAQVEGED